LQCAYVNRFIRKFAAFVVLIGLKHAVRHMCRRRYEGFMNKKYIWVAIIASFLSVVARSAEPLDIVQQYVVEQAKAGREVNISIQLGAKETPARVNAANEQGLTVTAQALKLDLSWKKLGEMDPFLLYRTALAAAPANVRAALLELGIQRGRTGDKVFQDVLTALWSDDPELAKKITAAAAAASSTPLASPAVPQPVPAKAEVRSIGPFKDKVVRDGKVDRAAYVAQALGGDVETINRRFGPDAASFQKNYKNDAPEIFLRHADGEYIYKEKDQKKQVDWTGMGGQCLYVPNSPKESGVDRMMFCWSYHEGHGASKFWHCYRLRPARSAKEGGEWWAEDPDPLLKRPQFAKPPAPRYPVAVGRGHVEWSNHGIVAFSDGLIGASGSGNSGDKYPTTQLPPGFAPTAVAVTNNNEFALITVWDLKELKGKLAVIALIPDRGYPDKIQIPCPGLPSNGYYSAMKYLGCVDLPFAAPSAIAASCDLTLWKWVLDSAADLDFSNAANREKWNNATSGSQSYARAGFAVIASRAENKIAFVDLAPLFQYYRKMYFGSAENAAKIKNVGPAENQWPFNFEAAPEQKPRVVQAIDMPQPTAVATGYADSNAKGFESKAVVAMMDGQLAVYDVGSLIFPKSKDGIKLVGSTPIGKNPTCIAYGRSAPQRDTLVVVCRGDNEIQWVKLNGNVPKVVRRLRDSRLTDPVWAEISDTRGASVLSVADFKGGKVVNYLTAPINSWDEELFGKLGADGKAEFECGGVQTMPGNPYMISGAEVP